MKRIIVLSSLILCLCTSSMAQRLFHFERSTNDNIVCYDVNLKNGKLNLSSPTKTYWSDLEHVSSRSGSDLSWLEKKLAFGFVVDKKGNNEVTGHLSPSKKLAITICQRNGKWVAACRINGKDAILNHLFVQMKGAMSAAYVDVFGVAADGSGNLKMRIK